MCVCVCVCVPARSGRFHLNKIEFNHHVESARAGEIFAAP